MNFSQTEHIHGVVRIRVRNQRLTSLSPTKPSLAAFRPPPLTPAILPAVSFTCVVLSAAGISQNELLCVHLLLAVVVTCICMSRLFKLR